MLAPLADPPRGPVCLHWGTCEPATIPALLGCRTGSLGSSQNLSGELRKCLSSAIPPLTFGFHWKVLSSIEQLCINTKIHTCKHLFMFAELQLKRRQSWLWEKESFQDLWKAVVIDHLHCAQGKDVTIQQELWWNLPSLKLFYRDRDTNGRRKRSYLIPGKGRQSIISRFALCIGFTLWRKICCFLLYFCCGWPVKQAHKYSMHMPVVPAAVLITKI